MKDSVKNINSSSSSSLVSVSDANPALEFPTKNVKKVFLFYCAETQALAEKIAAQSDAIELRNISWKWGFLLIFVYNITECSD